MTSKLKQNSNNYVLYLYRIFQTPNLQCLVRQLEGTEKNCFLCSEIGEIFLKYVYFVKQIAVSEGSLGLFFGVGVGGETCIPVLWIRIRPIRIGTGTVSILCRCIFYFFHENLSMLYKINKIMTHWPLRNEKRKTLQTGIAVNRSKKKFASFSNMCKTWQDPYVESGSGSGSRLASNWKVGSSTQLYRMFKSLHKRKFLFFRKCIRFEPARGKTGDRKHPDCHYDL